MNENKVIKYVLATGCGIMAILGLYNLLFSDSSWFMSLLFIAAAAGIYLWTSKILSHNE
ncbi:MAG: hypothetical protein PHO79_00860 [Desulfoplanes sp.]|nr:hypothetical protein [Desulfoplanes sp.]MDD4648564.1 hypothetical protein [Desulfoplanes sp.]